MNDDTIWVVNMETDMPIIKFQYKNGAHTYCSMDAKTLFNRILEEEDRLKLIERSKLPADEV